jgi:hypothetical protein
MISRPIRCGANRRLAVEAATTGLAFGSGLCWATTCLVASFRPHDLADPYWHGIRGFRTDTCGFVAFILTAFSLALSEYLRLQRQQDSRVGSASASSPGQLAALAVSETVAVLSTGLVAYLSVNVVTHPATLNIRATHFAPWPTEGTLRVIGLALCVGSTAALRYLWSWRVGTRRPTGRPVADLGLRCSHERRSR